jgi:hypothetical protein
MSPLDELEAFETPGERRPERGPVVSWIFALAALAMVSGAAVAVAKVARSARRDASPPAIETLSTTTTPTPATTITTTIATAVATDSPQTSSLAPAVSPSPASTTVPAKTTSTVTEVVATLRPGVVAGVAIPVSPAPPPKKVTTSDYASWPVIAHLANADDVDVVAASVVTGLFGEGGEPCVGVRLASDASTPRDICFGNDGVVVALVGERMAVVQMETNPFELRVSTKLGTFVSKSFATGLSQSTGVPVQAAVFLVSAADDITGWNGRVLTNCAVRSLLKAHPFALQFGVCMADAAIASSAHTSTIAQPDSVLFDRLGGKWARIANGGDLCGSGSIADPTPEQAETSRRLAAACKSLGQ